MTKIKTIEDLKCLFPFSLHSIFRDRERLKNAKEPDFAPDELDIIWEALQLVDERIFETKKSLCNALIDVEQRLARGLTKHQVWEYVTRAVPDWDISRREAYVIAIAHHTGRHDCYAPEWLEKPAQSAPKEDPLAGPRMDEELFQAMLRSLSPEARKIYDMLDFDNPVESPVSDYDRPNTYDPSLTEKRNAANERLNAQAQEVLDTFFDPDEMEQQYEREKDEVRRMAADKRIPTL